MQTKSLHQTLIQTRITYFISIGLILMLGTAVGMLSVAYIAQADEPSSQINALIDTKLLELKTKKNQNSSMSIHGESESELWKHLSEQLNNHTDNIQQCNVFKLSKWHASCIFSSGDESRKSNLIASNKASTTNTFTPLLDITLFGREAPAQQPPPTAAQRLDPTTKSWFRSDNDSVKYYNDTQGQWR